MKLELQKLRKGTLWRSPAWSCTSWNRSPSHTLHFAVLVSCAQFLSTGRISVLVFVSSFATNWLQSKEELGMIRAIETCGFLAGCRVVAINTYCMCVKEWCAPRAHTTCKWPVTKIFHKSADGLTDFWICNMSFCLYVQHSIQLFFPSGIGGHLTEPKFQGFSCHNHRLNFQIPLSSV